MARREQPTTVPLSRPGSGSRGPLFRSALFAGLACAISWAWLLPIAFSGGTIFAGSGWPTHFPAVLGPLLAAVILTAWFQGRSGLQDLVRRMVRGRVALRWWLVALSPVLVLVSVLAGELLVGASLPRYGDFAVFSGLPTSWGVVGVFAALLLIGGYGEETGWRGYLQAQLQMRLSPLAATAIVAVVWAIWHLPLFVTLDSYQSFDLPIVIGWFIGLFCGAILLTWLYNRSGGSILLVVVWHATYDMISGTDAATGLPAATSTMLVIFAAITLVVLEIRSRHFGRPSVLGPRPCDSLTAE